MCGGEVGGGGCYWYGDFLFFLPSYFFSLSLSLFLLNALYRGSKKRCLCGRDHKKFDPEASQFTAGRVSLVGKVKDMSEQDLSSVLNAYSCIHYHSPTVKYGRPGPGRFGCVVPASVWDRRDLQATQRRVVVDFLEPSRDIFKVYVIGQEVGKDKNM